MTSKDINELILSLSEHFRMLEDAYVENGGEVTDETISLEDSIEDMKTLLLGDGVDSLGRWLKSKEDQKAALKDEKAKIDSMMKSVDRTIEYVKELIEKTLAVCNADEVKGVLYAFKRTTSVTHSPNTDLIEERYTETLEKVAEQAGLPAWLRLKISPSWSLVPDGMLTDEFITTTTPTVSFKKPRKSSK